ncbi:MAG: choice-of-anchor D domain-containing protein, partial [Candidatus Eisenbacteria bacterium]
MIASGKAFPLERLAARKGFPAALEAAPAGETDKGTRFTSRAPAAPPGKRVAGEEVFGSTQNSFFFGPRTRGNIFRCTKNRSLREHRLYLHVIRPTQLWFLVYEGMQQYGTYNLVSASNVSPAVSGEGWYSSGPLNVQLVAGRYYMICASFEEVCEYFNELEISPYPIPASFGELIAGAGWNWAPTAHFPPDPSQAVPSDAFGDAAAYYQTLVTGPGIGWVEVQPRSGRTAPGVDATLAVRLDAGGLFGGDYRANLVEPERRLPVHLRVTGVPNIVLSRTAFDFGKVFIGTERSDTLIVKNLGTDQLVVKGLATDIPDFIFDSSPFTVAPGESLVRTVTFRPTQAVARSGTLTVTSNDPDQGVLSLGLHGEGLVPPGIEVTPDSLALTLLSGQSATRTLTLRNPGGSDLIWEIGPTFPSGASLANARVESRSPVFSSPRRTAVKVEGAGLTSPSTQARGSLGRPSRPPESEIFRSAPAAPQPLGTSPGAPLEDLLQHLDQNHDAVSVLIPDRYDFQEGENGTFILDGGDDMYDLGNLLFTNLGGPLEYSAGQIQTAPILGGSGRYFTVKYPGLFVLAADLEGVTDFTITGNLGADGEGSVDGAVLVTEVAGTTYRGFVKRVYNAGDPSVNHLVIVADGPGLAHEFSLSTDSDFHNVSGLSQTRRLYYVLYAGAGGSYIGDGPALEIMNAFLQALDLAPRWLSATPGSGTVPAGGSTGISVRFDATGLLGGDHAANLVVRHNVPGQPPLRVPTLLRAIGVPQLQVSPGTLSFGQVFAGGSRTDTLVVSNVGTDTLRVSGLGVDRAEFTLDPSGFSLAPGASRPVTVTFSSASIGVYDGRLTIRSDDPDDPEVSVALHAEAVAPPHATLSPASLTASLATGEHMTQFLQLGNTGGSDLVFQVDLDAGAAAAAAAGPEAAPPPSPVTRVEPAPSRARGARGPDGRDQRPPHGPSGFEERLARQLAALSSQARVYFDDMERGPNGWTTQAYGEDDLWHQTHTSFSSPSTSWWCALEPKGSYETGRRIQTAAVSPTIDLGGRGAPITLQFFENYNTEQGWDFCMVDVSADGGNNWEPLRGGIGSA